MKIIKIKNKADFPSLNYTGYLWYSNKKDPEVIEGSVVSDKDLTDLPFVVEGLLFSEAEGLSIRITNINGKYVIAKMDISAYRPEEVSTYLLDEKKFDGKKKFKIYQHYEAIPDPINENWSVLKPTWFAFIGFIN